MIEGAEHFTYLGLVRHDHGVMLVFREGALVLDIDRPGGGALLCDDMRRLLGLGPAVVAPAPALDDASDTDSASTSSEADAHADDLPAPIRVFGWMPADGAADPPHEDPWSPPGKLWGWTCSDTPVVTALVPQAVLDQAASNDRDVQRALWDGLSTARLPAPTAVRPAAGVLVGLTVAGRRELWAWTGHWWPSGDASHRSRGLTPGLACDLVRHARWSHLCAVPSVAYPRKVEYLGRAQDANVALLAFEQVQREAPRQPHQQHRRGMRVPAGGGHVAQVQRLVGAQRQAVAHGRSPNLQDTLPGRR